MMKNRRPNIIIIILLLSITNATAQYRDVFEQLERLKTILDRTSAMVNLLPRTSDDQLLFTVRSKLEQARTKYQQAETAANQQHFGEARILIAQVYAVLKQIEDLVRQYPIFRIKFREHLDNKIQQAESSIKDRNDREALYLLERAKFFRQRAFSMASQGRTFAALEYYRLAIYFADQVLKLTRIRDGREDRQDWRSYYTDTQLLLERARTLVEHAPSRKTPQLNVMVEKAESELKNIERLYEGKEFDYARKKLISLNQILYRIIDTAEDMPHKEAERLSLDLESLRYSLQTLQEGLTENRSPSAEALYQRVSRLTADIQQHIEQNQLELARRKLFFANQLVLRLYRLREEMPQGEPREIERQLTLANESLTVLQEKHHDSKSFAGLLALIEENLKQAEQAFAQKDYWKSSAYLKLTNRMILRFKRLQLRQFEKDLQRQAVQAELQRLAGLLARLTEAGEGDPNFNLQYQNAQRLYHLAEQASQNDELLLCNELTTLAINLITK